MQREAEQRVREMQSRARLLDGEKNFSSSPDIFPQKNPLSAITEKADGDRLLILALIFLLWNEKADQKLILALLYILLI